jgi:hypothetical protein
MENDGFKEYMRFDSTAMFRWFTKNMKLECVLCGLGTVWNGKPLRHHIDHIDGDRGNNKRDNLRLLCPNCHTQSETYCGRKNKGVGKKRPKDLGDVDWDQLVADVGEGKIHSYAAVLRNRGVVASSQNSTKLRYRCLKAGIAIDSIGRVSRGSHISAEELRAFLQLHSVVEAAIHFGESSSTMYRLIRDYGIAMPRATKGTTTKGTYPSDDELRIMYQTMPMTHIAKIIGVSDNAVKKYLIRRNIKG